MRIRFLQTVDLEKVNDDGSVSTFHKDGNKNQDVVRVEATADPEFVDIHFEDGYIKDVNVAIFSIQSGGITPYTGEAVYLGIDEIDDELEDESDTEE